MANIARRERSRSPVDNVAGSSSSSGILRTLDMKKMQLSLDGRVSKVMYFSEDDIWFEAKPVVLYLEYSSTSVSQTLWVVKDKNKKSLKELLDTRGQPKWGDLSDKSPGYHDLKALYVNEPGMYSLIFRSTKKQAQDFQDWVYEDVLTALRRHGSYKIGGDQAHALRTWLDGDLQMVLKKRDDELQLALKARDEALMVQLEVLIGLRDDRILSRLAQQCDRVVLAMQDSLRALIPNFSASLSQAVCFSLAQKFKDLQDDFRAAVSNPTGAFIDALRKAVKLPAMKRTTNPEKFPEEQRATPDEERFVESLSTLLTEELERMASQNSIFHAGRLPALSYGAWKRCRGLVGSRCLALRKLSGDASKPLLWSSTAGGGRFNGGGQHYVYLKASRSHVGGNAKEYLRRVLKQKLKKSRQSPSVEEHLRQLISSTPPETWPMSSSDVDVFQHDASEEKLGAEMEQ